MRNAALLVVALSACATAPRPPQWLPASGTFVSETHAFEVAVPAGWMREPEKNDVLLVTRDGPSLQRIEVGAVAAGEPLGIGKGAHRVSAGMTPENVADLFLEDAGAAVADLRLLERGAASLAGHEATRVVVSYLDGSGLRRRVAFYGFVDGGRAYYAVYYAPERHYYALDLPVFEEVARTLRLRPAAAAGAAAR